LARTAPAKHSRTVAQDTIKKEIFHLLFFILAAIVESIVCMDDGEEKFRHRVSKNFSPLL
jgi:hypothetical protein